MNAWRRRLLLHPATVLAALAVALNDAYLKQLHQGWFTGKLSDVAGVWMIGALLIALSGHRTLSIAAVAACFTLLKTVPSAARLAAPVLGGVTMTDASDLLALVVLPALWLFVGGLRADYRPERFTGLTFAASVAMVAATAAVTTATSCDTQSEVDAIRVTEDGSVLATLSEWSEEWFTLDTVGDPVRAANPVVDGAPSAGVSGCIDGRCFEVRVGEGLYEDGVPVYAMSAADRKRYDDRSSCFQAEPFSMMVIGRSGDEPAVWVSMGMAGVVRYRPADGSLTQFGIPGLNPVVLDGVALGPMARPAADRTGQFNWTVAVALGVLAVLLALGIVLVIDLKSRQRRGV